MTAARHHLEFAPPPTPGLVRAVGLALLAHLLLVAVLTVGVAWKRETPPVAVQAELWADLPQDAAPPVVEAPKAADIAVAKEKEKEKARLQKEKELQQAKAEQERKAQQDKKLAQEKQRKEQEAKAARDKEEKAEKAAKADALAKQKATKAAELAAQKNRDDQLKRMAALAGESTGSGGAGSAAKSAGPSASYNARVAGRIKPNVTYTDIIVGNPKTEVTVTLSAGGDILSSRISKSSGNKSWDNAALNAIDKTAKLPLDDGKVWSPMIIELSPQNLLGQ